MAEQEQAHDLETMLEVLLTSNNELGELGQQ